MDPSAEVDDQLVQSATTNDLCVAVIDDFMAEHGSKTMVTVADVVNFCLDLRAILQPPESIIKEQTIEDPNTLV